MKEINVKHSGHIGDIIYSLPFLDAFCREYDCYINYYINLKALNTIKHNSGKTMMTPKSFEYIRPLLMYTTSINSVEVYKDEKIDINLDDFRKENLNLSGNDIRLWYEKLDPTIRVGLADITFFNYYDGEERYYDYIIVNRTQRYNNRFIDYNILSKLDYPIGFVGTDEEFKIFQAQMEKKIEHIKVKDALHLCEIIEHCRVFIGNQSSSYAIAELTKAKRVLEQYYLAPNVLPQGGEYYTFQTQTQFEKILKFI